MNNRYICGSKYKVMLLYAVEYNTYSLINLLSCELDYNCSFSMISIEIPAIPIRYHHPCTNRLFNIIFITRSIIVYELHFKSIDSIQLEHLFNVLNSVCYIADILNVKTRLERRRTTSRDSSLCLANNDRK